MLAGRIGTLTSPYGQSIVAIVSDYDRTLTTDLLTLFEPAAEALRLLKEEHKLGIIIASGRRVDFLLNEFKAFRFVDAFVGENGAVLHLPKSAATLNLGGDMSQIKAALRSSSLPIEEGQMVISTKRAFEEKVKRVIQQRGLKAEIQYNRDSLMILPLGLSKAIGVKEAISRLGLPQGGLICIGDGENDLPLFEMASIRVATENAMPELKERADIVCIGPGGIGVASFLNDLSKNLSIGGSPSHLTEVQED